MLQQHCSTLSSITHLTHLLQPNDTGFNKAFKDNFTKQLGQLVSNEIDLSRSELAELCVNALYQDNIKKAVKNSFKHCGIEPLDTSKQIKMILSEHPNTNEQDPLLEQVVELVSSRYAVKDKAVQEAESRKATKKRRSISFSTSHATILTQNDTIADITLSNWLSNVNGMKVWAKTTQKRQENHAK